MKIIAIGIDHTPSKCKKDAPIQPFNSKVIGKIEVFKKYRDGLKDIESFSRLILVYKFHKSKGYCLRVKSFLDNKERGYFATCYSRRADQIGLTLLRLLRRKANTLPVKGIDMIDGPLLLDKNPMLLTLTQGKRLI